MGSYTPIVTSAATVTAKRRRLRVDSAHGRADREESVFAFACPECGEGSGFETECPRCDVAMRPTATSVELPRRSDARTAVRHGVLLGVVPALAALGTLFTLLFAVLAADGNVGPAHSYLAYAIIAMLILLPLAMLPPAALAAWAKLNARLEWAQIQREARARVGDTKPTDPSDAVEDPDPIRVRGRVRIENGGVRVCDERTGVRVPLTPQVRVLGDEGERFVLTDGEEVDAVGYGIRRLGAGEGYRDTRGELELDGSRPVELWIRE